MESNSVGGLLNLPVEIVSLIFGGLEVADLLRCAEASISSPLLRIDAIDEEDRKDLS